MKKEEFIAWIRHYVWCGFMMAAGQEYNEAPTGEQWSSLMQGVHYVERNRNNTPEQNHDNWWAKKKMDGWCYGPKKDIAMKEHPDMVPYEDLPEIERLKDDMDLMAHKMGRELWKNAEVRDWLADYKLNAHDLGIDPIVTERSCISCGTILVPTIDDNKELDGNWTCPNEKCPRGWLLTASFNAIHMEYRQIEHRRLSNAEMNAIHDKLNARGHEIKLKRKVKPYIEWCRDLSF